MGYYHARNLICQLNAYYDHDKKIVRVMIHSTYTGLGHGDDHDHDEVVTTESNSFEDKVTRFLRRGRRRDLTLTHASETHYRCLMAGKFDEEVYRVIMRK